MFRLILSIIFLSISENYERYNSLYVRADFYSNPDPFAFGDDAACDTEQFVMDVDGSSSMVVGGFTMSKTLVWQDAANIVPGKVAPSVS